MSSAAEREPGLEVGDVAAAGARWRIARRGGAGPPLLLCNGIGVNWQAFAPLIAALAPRPVIAFDVPGVGASPPLARRYTMPALAQRVHGLLDAIGVGRFDLLGVSWGGALAQQLALQSPQRCRRLVLAATSTGVLSFPGRLDALLQLADPRRFGADPGAAGALAQAYGGRVRDDPQALARYLGRLTPPSPEGYRSQLAAVALWTSLPWLVSLGQPTLILAGRDDPLVPLANARLMQALLRRSRLVTVDDGHLLLHTHAAELGPLIGHFLDG